MAVTIWAVLGIVFVLIGLPLAFASSWGLFIVGAGVAFLIVAAAEWAWSRWVTPLSEDEPILDPS